MIEKIRPVATVKWSDGNDGRDGRYYIEYRCPKCGKLIHGYHRDTACDECGTFYDWGNREPSIKVIREVDWNE